MRTGRIKLHGAEASAVRAKTWNVEKLCKCWFFLCGAKFCYCSTEWFMLLLCKSYFVCSSFLPSLLLPCQYGIAPYRIVWHGWTVYQMLQKRSHSWGVVHMYLQHYRLCSQVNTVVQSLISKSDKFKCGIISSACHVPAKSFVKIQWVYKSSWISSSTRKFKFKHMLWLQRLFAVFIKSILSAYFAFPLKDDISFPWCRSVNWRSLQLWTVILIDTWHLWVSKSFQNWGENQPQSQNLLKGAVCQCKVRKVEAEQVKTGRLSHIKRRVAILC